MARVMEILAHLCSIANANFTPWDANPRLQAGIFTFKCKYLCAGGHTAQFTGQREISFSANARRAVVSFPDPLPFESEAENLSRRAVHPQTHFSFCTSLRKTVEREFCMILAPRNLNFPC